MDADDGMGCDWHSYRTASGAFSITSHMSASALLLSFLNVCLSIAVVILIAFVILWVLQTLFGITLDANVTKWGRIVVALICLIIIISWLLSIVGAGPYLGPHFLKAW
jgi:uncharacterized membrane protein